MMVKYNKIWIRYLVWVNLQTTHKILQYMCILWIFFPHPLWYDLLSNIFKKWSHDNFIKTSGDIMHIRMIRICWRFPLEIFVSMTALYLTRGKKELTFWLSSIHVQRNDEVQVSLSETVFKDNVSSSSWLGLSAVESARYTIRHDNTPLVSSEGLVRAHPLLNPGFSVKHYNTQPEKVMGKS